MRLQKDASQAFNNDWSLPESRQEVLECQIIIVVKANSRNAFITMLLYGAPALTSQQKKAWVELGFHIPGKQV
jgi:hypothetical protein